MGKAVSKIRFYEIDEEYIDYMCQFDKHLFHNKQAHQQNARKYIGILFKVNDLDYFVPLSIQARIKTQITISLYRLLGASKLATATVFCLKGR